MCETVNDREKLLNQLDDFCCGGKNQVQVYKVAYSYQNKFLADTMNVLYYTLVVAVFVIV